MTLSGNDFVNNNPNFENEIFDVTPGELIFTAIEASVKIIGKNNMATMEVSM